VHPLVVVAVFFSSLALKPPRTAVLLRVVMTIRVIDAVVEFIIRGGVEDVILVPVGITFGFGTHLVPRVVGPLVVDVVAARSVLPPIIRSSLSPLGCRPFFPPFMNLSMNRLLIPARDYFAEIHRSIEQRVLFPGDFLLLEVQSTFVGEFHEPPVSWVVVEAAGTARFPRLNGQPSACPRRGWRNDPNGRFGGGVAAVMVFVEVNSVRECSLRGLGMRMMPVREMGHGCLGGLVPSVRVVVGGLLTMVMMVVRRTAEGTILALPSRRQRFPASIPRLSEVPARVDDDLAPSFRTRSWE